MADTIAITAGSGTTINTDDVGGVHTQRVKLTWGTDGTVTDASASNPVPTVQTGALPAGTNNIGLVVPAPQAAVNGATASRVNAAASTNATSLKTSAGNIYGIHVF